LESVSWRLGLHFGLKTYAGIKKERNMTLYDTLEVVLIKQENPILFMGFLALDFGVI